MSMDKAQRDLADATDALAAYWGRYSTDTDYKLADLHMATEALLRAVSSVALAVEHVERDLAREVVNRQDAIHSVRNDVSDLFSQVQL